MKRYLALLPFFAASFAFAQNPVPIVFVVNAPTGSCSPGNGNVQVVSTGTQYSCGSVNPQTGVGTWTAIGGSGTIPPAGIPLSTGSAFGTSFSPTNPIPITYTSFLPNFYSMQTNADSFGRGLGSTQYTQNSMAALLCSAIDTTICATNQGVGGTAAPQITLAGFANEFFDPWVPSFFFHVSGNNDATHDTACTSAFPGNYPTDCTQNFSISTAALRYWEDIPVTYKCMAAPSAASQAAVCPTPTTTGTWTTYSASPIFSNPILASLGTQLTSSVASSTITLKINDPDWNGTTGDTKLGAWWPIANTGNGNYGLTVDGVAETEPCAGVSTTISGGPCNGTALSIGTTTFFWNEWTITPATQHTIVVTKDATTNPVAFTGIYLVPLNPATTSGVNYSADLGPNCNYGTTLQTAAYDHALSVVIAGVYADLGTAFFGSELTGNPGVNCLLAPNGDLNTSATITTPGSLPGGHPNNHGHRKAALTILNAIRATGVQVGNIGINPMANSGNFVGPIVTNMPPQPALPNNVYFNNFNPQGAFAGIDIVNTNTPLGPTGITGRLKWGTDSTSGTKAWSSKRVISFTYSAAQLAAIFCWGSNTNPALENAESEANYTHHDCMDPLTGVLSMDGYITTTPGAALTVTGANQTIAPVSAITDVGGTGSIQTITTPTWVSSVAGTQLTFIATAAWTWVAGGNLGNTGTAVANTPYTFTYDGTNWYGK